MVGIWAPAGYLAFLCGSLSIFSRYYRRQSNVKPPYVPWFPQHKARDIYISLLSLPTPPPREILIAALIRRAMEDVKQIWLIREQKVSLSLLIAKGQVGEELLERFIGAEKELEAEIVEVVGEANSFMEGYGGMIFGLASDMVAHEKWTEIYYKIEENRTIEQTSIESGPSGTVFGSLSYLTPSSLTLSPSNPLPAEPVSTPITAGISAPSPVTIARESTPVIPASNGLAPPAQLPVAPPSPVVEQEVTPEPEVQEEDEEEEQEGSSVVSPASTSGSRTPSKKSKKKKKPAKK